MKTTRPLHSGFHVGRFAAKRPLAKRRGRFHPSSLVFRPFHSGFRFHPSSLVLWLLLVFAFLIGRLPALAEDSKQWALASRLYTDVKAHRVGDLLTVLVMESSSSTKEANSKTDKKTALSGNLSFFHPRMDNNPTAWTNVVIPAFSAEAARNFEGSGTMKNEETVTSTITVRVIEVLPNGNLLVEGKRFMNIQGETLTYLLSGTVRTTDITRDNTVKSTSIGDLNIQTLSQGTIARNQKKGLFTQIVDWVNPF